MVSRRANLLDDSVHRLQLKKGGPMLKFKQPVAVAVLMLFLVGCASTPEVPTPSNASPVEPESSQAADSISEKSEDVEMIEPSELQSQVYLKISPEELGEKLTCGALGEQDVGDGITGYSCYRREDGPFTVFFEGPSSDAVAEWIRSDALEISSDEILVSFGKFALLIPALDSQSLKALEEIGVDKLEEIERDRWYSAEPLE